MPLLSVIVPHHNHLRGLPRLFDSMLAQSFKDMEVVLVDDCSDEPCGQIVEAYRKKGLNIVCIEQKTRCYRLKTRLAGIAAASGRIIGFADADDMLWGAEALEKNVRLHERHKADILHFRSVLINEDGSFLTYAPLADPFAQLLEGGAILEGYAGADIWGVSSLWNKLFSRELLLAAVKEAENPHFSIYREDCWLSTILFSLAKRYVGSDHTGYGYFWQDKRRTAEPDRALASYRWMRSIPPLLQGKSCPPALAEKIRRNVEKVVIGDLGHMCIALFREGEPTRALAAVQRHCDRDVLLEALLYANSVNAARLLEVYGAFHAKNEESSQ